MFKVLKKKIWSPLILSLKKVIDHGGLERDLNKRGEPPFGFFAILIVDGEYYRLVVSERRAIATFKA